MTPLRVGIVGGAGQVGTALMKAFTLDDQLSPFAICRNKLSAARLACQGLVVRIADTSDPGQLFEVAKDLDVIVNCALPLYGCSKTSAANRRLASSLLQACAGKRLIHLSSIAVYGEFTRERISLFANPRPDSLYGRQKLQMEKLLHALKKHSVACTVLRLGHVYGPEMNWSQVFLDLLQSEDFCLPFDGAIASNAVSVTNVVIAIRHLLLKGPSSGLFNVTNMPQSSWREILDLHARAGNCTSAASLTISQSEELSEAYKRWADTRLSARIMSETAGWLKSLPASFVASVPSMKDLGRLILHRIASESLESRLKATYHALSGNSGQAKAPATLPCFVSEPMPGQYLEYAASEPSEDLPALQAWCRVISDPAAMVPTESSLRQSTSCASSSAS